MRIMMTLALLTTVPQVLRAQMQQANAVERMVTQLDSLAPEWLERFHVPGAGLASWRRSWWSRTARIAVSIQALVSVAAVAVLDYMNLIGYRW